MESTTCWTDQQVGRLNSFLKVCLKDWKKSECDCDPEEVQALSICIMSRCTALEIEPDDVNKSLVKSLLAAHFEAKHLQDMLSQTEAEVSLLSINEIRTFDGLVATVMEAADRVPYISDAYLIRRCTKQYSMLQACSDAESVYSEYNATAASVTAETENKRVYRMSGYSFSAGAGLSGAPQLDGLLYSEPDILDILGSMNINQQYIEVLCEKYSYVRSAMVHLSGKDLDMEVKLVQKVTKVFIEHVLDTVGQTQEER